MSAVIEPERLRRAVLLVAALNLLGFTVEVVVALRIGSVSLLADSVDFLEDASIAVLVALALRWTLARRAIAGHVLAVLILVPALAAGWQAIVKFGDPSPPDASAMILMALGAAAVNVTAAVILRRLRHDGGSLTAAAYLSARNDVAVNALIIVMAAITTLTRSGWPDLILGIAIIAINALAAREVWELAGEERLAARALAGEDLD